MKVFIVYCHPSKNSFTYEVKKLLSKDWRVQDIHMRFLICMQMDLIP